MQDLNFTQSFVIIAMCSIALLAGITGFFLIVKAVIQNQKFIKNKK